MAVGSQTGGGMVDWKSYYRAEIGRPEGRAAILGFINRAGDPRIEEAIDRGAIVSFPHTALRYAGPLQALLVSALYRRRISRIISLGVLHGAGREAFRTARDERSPLEERRAAFAEVAGGFAPRGDRFDTPFGRYPTWIPTDRDGPFRIDLSGILSSEFSLDTFVSILAVGAEVFGREPIPIFPLFIGMTREPITGDFAVARRIAAWLRGLAGPGVAVVTTGDLVHYGTAYSAPGETVGGEGPRLTEGFRAEVERMLEAGLIGGKDEEAYRISTEILKSDQREILPVVAAYLEGRRGYDILHFALSDYAGILGVEPPCYVASALLTYG